MKITKQLLLTSLAIGIACQVQAAPAPAKTTFVHLFEWNWQDVAKECEDYLGPAGYSAVQVSPPNEHIQGSQWWTRYQPVSYQINSRGGTRAEFIDMVNRCEAQGVSIYVDAIINHMASGSGTGVAGSPYGAKQFPNYSPQDFHPTCAISDYGNRYQVQNCELVGLADLNTSNNYVQTTLAGYLNDLQNIGVAGFRFDASKHMSATDIQGVMSKVSGSPFVFQEVIDQGGEAISAGEYTGIGNVTEFKYSTNLGNTFRDGKLSWLENFGEGWGFMASANAVVFVDNHDNQRGHGGAGNVITFADGRLYDLANVFMLAYPYGYPKVMSSYDFHHDTDVGGPNVPVHNGANLECFGSGWQCEHRWSYIAGGVDFRNYTNDNWTVDNWWDNGGDQISFSRGDQGHVVINKEDAYMTNQVPTGMAAGQYCNVLKGKISNDQQSCSDEVITVNSDGSINTNIAPWDAIAIHHGAKLSGVTTPSDIKRTVIFIQAQTSAGQDMFVRGGIDHNYANNNLGRNCSTGNFNCAIAISHNNLRNTTTAPWKSNEHYIDWYGAEAGQSNAAEGTALDWTTNLWSSSWGALRTVAQDGFGLEDLNNWGAHYWMLDVDMDCSQTVNGYFEIKAYVKNGQGWEGDITQANTPFPSKNHVAQCGKINTFTFDNNAVSISNL